MAKCFKTRPRLYDVTNYHQESTPMLRLFSPAKINLFLRVVSKRPDGYHHLSSVFQTITLGDTLTIACTNGEQDDLTCTHAALPTDASNLILKATALFRRKTGSQQHFKIHLIKRIPTEAGLGGGSSNAATTLWACNQLAQTQVSLTDLKQWGAEIGSDVPFFFSQGTAYCTGRGENVYHLPAFPQQPVWIIKPEEGLSTPEVYRRLKLAAPVPEQTVQRDLDAFLSGALPHFNDLETPAFEIKPELKQLKMNLMENGFKTVVMSGSGSAFFCLGQGKPLTASHLNCFPVHFTHRILKDWYQEPSL